MTKYLFIFILFFGAYFFGNSNTHFAVSNAGSIIVQHSYSFNPKSTLLFNDNQFLCESVEENTDDSLDDDHEKECTSKKITIYSFSFFLEDFSEKPSKLNLYQKTPLFVFNSVFRL